MAVLPSLAGAEAPPPTLPPISPQDLLVKVQQADVAGLSGTVSFKANLGLPDLSSFLPSSEGLAPTLLSGEHTAKVWVAGHDKVRVAFPTDMAESDVVHSGNDVWVWQSDGKQVTHLTLGRGDGGGATETSEHDQDASKPDHVAPTPQALADKLLSSLDPTTRVFVRDTATVADRPTYELVLAPKSDTTLVADVVIAVDSATGLPLRVQVLSKDSGDPALDVGFTSIDFSVPGDGTFAFSPPPGSQVTEATSPADLFMPHDNANADHEGTRHHRGQPGDGAGAAATNSAAAQPKPEPTIVTKGDGWGSIVVITPPPGSSTGPDQTLDMVKKLATPVSGSWGSGKLLHTALLNVLFLDDGRILVGSVNEPTLEAAV
jgi:outer membrane lipoprotein-sorting protein